MIFDRVQPDRVPVDPCVPLGRRLLRTAADWPTHPEKAVKRKIAGRPRGGAPGPGGAGAMGRSKRWAPMPRWRRLPPQRRRSESPISCR